MAEPNPGSGHFRRGAVLVLVAAAILAVVLVTLHFTNLSAARSDLGQATAKGPVVQVVEAGAAPSQRTVTVLASVTPYQQATLYAKVSGYLSKVLVDKGDTVKAGQLLATIQSQETEAQYNSARADLANKQRIAQRYGQLLRQGAIAPQQAEQAAADARVSAAAVQQYGTLRSYQSLVAPFSGRITARFADPGALVQNAGTVGLIAHHRRLALLLAPAPILLILYLGNQSRFFARWMLPAYPFLCLLAAYGIVALATRLRWRVALPALASLVLLQGLVFSVHNDLVLAKADTRMLARDWMAENIPIGTKIVVEPIAPDQWAADAGHPLFGDPPAGTGSGNRWNKYATSRSCFFNGKLRETAGTDCPVIKLEDYERTTRPALLGNYERGGFCWVVTGSTQYGRAYADPKTVPSAIAYYDALKQRGKQVFHVSPYGDAKPGFSFDFSFNYYPLEYDHPGPEIFIYKLPACDTGAK